MDLPPTVDQKIKDLDLHPSIANGFITSKIYDKRDDFDFDIVNLRNRSALAVNC